MQTKLDNLDTEMKKEMDTLKESLGVVIAKHDECYGHDCGLATKAGMCQVATSDTQDGKFVKSWHCVCNDGFTGKDCEIANQDIVSAAQEDNNEEQ